MNAIADFLARTTPRIRTTPRNGGHLPAHQAAHAIGYSVDGGHSLHAAYRGSPHSGSMYPGSRRSVHPQRTSYNESPHPHVSDHQQQVDERRKFSGRKSGHEYETLGPPMHSNMLHHGEHIDPHWTFELFPRLHCSWGNYLQCDIVFCIVLLVFGVCST